MTDFGLPLPDVDRDYFYQGFVDNRRETLIIKERSRLFYEENINKLNHTKLEIDNFDFSTRRLNSWLNPVYLLAYSQTNHVQSVVPSHGGHPSL